MISSSVLDDMLFVLLIALFLSARFVWWLYKDELKRHTPRRTVSEYFSHMASPVFMFTCSVIAVFGTLVLFMLLALSIDLINSRINLMISYELTMVPAIILAVVFYWARGKHTFIYGLGEVIVGIISAWVSIHSSTTDLLSKRLGLFGGIYVIVRGLDNMDKDLPDIVRPLWDDWFPKRKPAR